MSRRLKEMIETELHRRYADLDSALVVNVHGLTGTEVNVLRADLRKKNIEMHVVKNTAMRRVLAGTRLEALGPRLEGPCAFVTGGTSTVDNAKSFLEYLKEYPKLEPRFGVVDGEPDVLAIEDIAKRRSKAELQGDVVMLAVSPGRRIAGCLNVGGKVAGCIKAIIEKLEKGESIAKVA